MTKSGCCWHEYNTYRVEKNKPVLEESKEEGVVTNNDYSMEKLTVTKNGKTTIDAHFEFLGYESEALLRFSLKNAPQKEVMILGADYRSDIDYAFFDKHKEEVEFSYKLASYGYLPYSKFKGKIEPMRFDSEHHALCFNNGNVKYRVIDASDKLGVEILQHDQLTFLPGDMQTKKGSLDKIDIERYLKNGELIKASCY